MLSVAKVTDGTRFLYVCLGMENAKMCIRDRARGGKETDYSVYQFVEGRGGNYFLMTKRKNIYHPYISFAPHTRFVPVKTHVHKWIELSYMYSGSCTQIINEEKTVKLEKGQVIRCV